MKDRIIKHLKKTNKELSAEEIEQLFCQFLVSSSFVFEKIPYRRFKRTSSKTDKVLYEYLFYGKK